MSWKHSYLERAQHIIAMRNSISSPDVTLAEALLEEDICGRLSVHQCLELLDWLFDMPYSQATSLLMSYIPESLSEYHAEKGV